MTIASFILTTLLSYPSLANSYPESDLFDACRIDLPKKTQGKLSDAQVSAACDCLFRKASESEKKKFSGEEWLAVAEAIRTGSGKAKKPLKEMTKAEMERHKGVFMFSSLYLMGLERPEVKKCTEISAGK